jgi:hypothetical protein
MSISKLIMIRVRPLCLLFVLMLVTAGCSRGSDIAGHALWSAAAAVPSPAGTTTGVAAVSPSATAEPEPTAKPATKPAAKPKPTSDSGLTAADRQAGLRSTKVPWNASGRLITVPGHSAAPGKGRVYTVKVQVEKGLDVDRAAFATFVLATLNDPRSWTEHGTRRFARTDSADADIRVVLASPATSASLCLPLRTFGKLSCHPRANTAVLTYYRWVKAISGYGGNRTGYREYVVNHEVGHVLGHRHEYCAGRGKRAPVMMQQTKGLRGCRPNPWPHP